MDPLVLTLVLTAAVLTAAAPENTEDLEVLLKELEAQEISEEETQETSGVVTLEETQETSGVVMIMVIMAAVMITVVTSMTSVT